MADDFALDDSKCRTSDFATLKIVAGNMGPILTIRPDGELIFGPDAHPKEAVEILLSEWRKMRSLGFTREDVRELRNVRGDLLFGQQLGRFVLIEAHRLDRLASVADRIEALLPTEARP